MVSERPMRQPKMVARSLTTAVSRPIMSNEQRKVSQPPPTEVGGMRANSTWPGRHADGGLCLIDRVIH